MEQPDPKHYNDFLQGSIQILDTLVLSIVLPPEIVSAINRQTEEYYLIQEYKFRVEREAEESKRKQVEANGIAAFQKTVSQGISNSYLRWRGIEATLALAQSRNAKVVVIGTGKDGLPIILGNVDAPAAAEGTSQSATKDTTPPNGAQPPAADTTLPDGGSTTPGAPPAGGGSSQAAPPPGSSNPSQPPAAAEKAAGPPSASASPPAAQSLPSPLELSEIGTLLSRIANALRSVGSTPAPTTETPPKQ